MQNGIIPGKYNSYPMAACEPVRPEFLARDGHSSHSYGEKTEKEDDSGSRRDSSGATILVVDDNDEVRRLIEKILTRQGFRIISAKNGKEALAVIEEQPEVVDLLLTDLVMPHLDGGDLVRRMNEMGVDFPILFVSGYSENFDVAREAASSRRDFLRKPFSPALLVRKVRKLLENA